MSAAQQGAAPDPPNAGFARVGGRVSSNVRRPMSIQDWGAIGEVIGSIGVILTLFYLSNQIRQSNRATKAATYQRIYEDLRENLKSLSSDIRVRVRDSTDLSEEQRSEYGFWRISTMRAYESWWKQNQYGVLDDDVFESYMMHMDRTLELAGSSSTSSTKDWWYGERRVRFIDGFEEYVD